METTTEMATPLPTTTKPQPAKKTDLTPIERLHAAHMSLIGGIDQHNISALFAVNGGRVNEAIAAIRFALDQPRLVRKLARETAHAEQAKADEKAAKLAARKKYPPSKIAAPKITAAPKA